MTPHQATQYLISFINHEIHLHKTSYYEFKLDRVRQLLARLGDPQKKLRFVHVAGSKGKGSVCVLMASILEQAGYKVGLYTSPHLYDYSERIRILQSPESFGEKHDSFKGKIPRWEMADLLNDLKPAIENFQAQSERLSFFEVFTVLAIYYFYKSKVDIVVLETGLGGRLDATNVVSSLVAAITPISLEHTQQLGRTLAKIAAEKAAIIKDKNQAVVVAPQKLSALKVIKERCRQVKARAIFIGEDVQYQLLKNDVSGSVFQIATSTKTLPALTMRFLGQHQVINAAVAIGIVEALRKQTFKISDAAIEKGVARALWPGRFEIVRRQPVIILDGAHNPASAQALVKTLKSLWPDGKITFILGLSLDKDITNICRIFDRIAAKIIFTKANHPRAADLSSVQLTKLFPKKEVVVTSNVSQALRRVFGAAQKRDVIVVTGSLFLIGEARKMLVKG